MNTIAIIQARIKSERLPGKVLMDLPYGNGKPLLKWVTDTIKSSKVIDKCIIATSANRENNQIEEFCKENNIQCYRGSEMDVLSRFISICKSESADVIIRLTGDNPILDIEKLDQAVNKHIKSDADYTSTYGLPLGMNFEIISGKAFRSINEEASYDEKEHVTLYFKNRALYKKHSIDLSDKDELHKLRLTIDYSEDYLVASHLLSNLKNNELPSLNLVERIYNETPWIFKVNSSKIQKNVFSNFSDEKKEAVQVLRRFGFDKSANVLENA